MCRIAGIVNKQLPLQAVEEMVLQMCNLQKHGGPDDGGSYTSEPNNLVLGNRRLALLDLSQAGHQPMQYENRYFITYNGEMYNFLCLKNELIKCGYHFITDTDTEVILAAFAQWNTHAFAKFNGMFAFALLDAHEKELYLVRDGAGMKPLYYSTVSGGLCFASEIGAFKPIPFLQQTNNSWPVYLMAYGHMPEPVTTLKNVQPLHKGCFLKYELQTGNHSLQSFSHFSYSQKHYGSSEASLVIDKKLRQAVERHLIADAPIGVFLSGGLDSSIIATIASQFKHSSLNTFSLFFNEESYSEKKYQDLVLQNLECNAYQHLLKEEEFHNSFPSILGAMDMPGCDGINTWFISKYAKAEGLKAVLSGIGADELFGGYPSFKRINIALMLQNLPSLAISAGRRSDLKQLNRLCYLKIEGIKGIYLFLRGHFTPYEIAKQLGADEKEIWALLNDLPALNDVSSINTKNQASWLEFNLYMQNQLLRDADVMGMAHGVEIRVPFLDQEFVRLAMMIDPEVKYEGPMSKQLLINSFKNILPEAIWNRPKMGFSFPFEKWLGSSTFVQELMNTGNINTKANFKKFKEGRLHWSRLMSLILLRSQHHA